MWGETSHFSVTRYVLTGFVTCGRSLSCWWITLSCLSWYTTLNWPLQIHSIILPPWNSVWPSTWRHVRAFPMIFFAWNRRSGPIFRRQSQCHVKAPPDSVFEAAVYKQRNAKLHSCLSLSSRGHQLWGKYIALALFCVLLCFPKMLYTESGLLLNPSFKLEISRTLINNIRYLKNTMDTKLSCSKLGN